MVVRYGALKIVKMSVSENLHNDFLRHIVGLEKVHRLYVTHRIRASSNTIQYKVTNDWFLTINS